MANRSLLGRTGTGPADHERCPEALAPERSARRVDGDAHTFGRMKRAIRKAERRAGDGTEIGGTGATILKFLAAPLVRLVEKERIGTEEVRAADDIAIAFHAQAGALFLGAQNAFTPPVRVSGVGTAARDYTWTASGSWTGTLTFQRSFDGAT